MNYASRVLFVSAIVLLIGGAIWFTYARTPQGKDEVSKRLPEVTIPMLGEGIEQSADLRLSGEEKILQWKTNEGTDVLVSFFKANGRSLDEFVVWFQTHHGVIDYSMLKEVVMADRRALQFEGNDDLAVSYVMFKEGDYIVSLSMNNIRPRFIDKMGQEDSLAMQRMSRANDEAFKDITKSLTVK